MVYVYYLGVIPREVSNKNIS